MKENEIRKKKEIKLRKKELTLLRSASALAAAAIVRRGTYPVKRAANGGTRAVSIYGNVDNKQRVSYFCSWMNCIGQCLKTSVDIRYASLFTKRPAGRE
jgi:hypothetical protein